MKTTKIKINNIPAIIWGEELDKVYLFVHGKMSSKEAAEQFAGIAEEKGYQTISFDLPQHGERLEENERCHIWEGMRDLAIMGRYVFGKWKEVSLFACSLGAYFSLQTYGDYPIKKCLFQSPVLDMEYLIQQMMLWFSISAERLEQEKEIETPIDLMTWDYYQYVKKNPTRKWDIPTSILYGGKDDLQSQEVIRDFSDTYNCALRVAENSEHSFLGENDRNIIEQWLRNEL